MNDFESVLELRLKHLLDPVVASQPPARRSRDRRRPFLTVLPAGGELAMEAIPAVDSVVTVQVTPAR
ncbi:MAG TPA: hypothetical protein VI172_11035 [Candidatus Dormibacteraeota bacterium]|jgi:hypothetical protein